MTQTHYKCMNKISDEIYADQWGNTHVAINETVTSADQYGFCCLPTLEAAQDLLETYTEDAKDCDQLPPWNTIVKVAVHSVGKNWSPYPNTTIALSYTILAEVY